MVNNDFMSLVHTRPAKFWKETLALICTVSSLLLIILKCVIQDVLMSLTTCHECCFFEKQFAEGDEWTSLCDALASHLLSSGFTLAATLCYICAGNVDQTVDIWSRSLEKDNARESYPERVQVSIVEFYISSH